MNDNNPNRFNHTVDSVTLADLVNDHQLHIPDYQRWYAWTPVQAEQLWKDIISVTENGDEGSHFCGSA
jgi:uncharacterized protein with ParB-like and HNH nuclease domain